MTEQTKRGPASPDQQGDNKSNAGPDRLPSELDNSDQWDDVAADRGYQKGEQGGYRGSYDETKLQQVKDKDVNPDEGRKVRDDAAATGGRVQRG